MEVEPMRDLNKFMNGALAEKMELAMVEVADNKYSGPQLPSQGQAQDYGNNYF